MKIKFAIIISGLMLLIATSSFALQPVKTPAAKKVMADAVKILEQRDFDALENMLGRYLKKGERVEDGQWKLHLAMDGISGLAAQFYSDAATVEKNFALVSEWVAAKPNSTMAKTALANAWIARAWTYRGMKLASETSQQQFTTMESGLENAFRVLQEIGDSSEPNPELFMAWLLFAVGAGAPPEVTDDIYKKGNNFYPEYFYITLQYLVSKFERWSGDADAVPNVLKQLSSDKELFARTIWHLVVYDEKNKLMTPTYVDAAKEGFTIIKEKYNAEVTANQISYLACFHWHDPAVIKKMDTMIMGNPDSTIWGKSENYKNCVNWAEQSIALQKK